MVFGSSDAPRVRVGDLFEKQGNPRTIWRVDALIERPGHPPHVRLVDDARRCDATVATSVLAGPEYRAVGTAEAN